MAVIVSTNSKQSGVFNVTETTLTEADTLAYLSGSGQLLILTNETGSIVAPVLKGNQATSLEVPGYGTVSLAAGSTVSVPANGKVAIHLDDIAAFLKGTSVAVTGGTGLTAALLN